MVEETALPVVFTEVDLDIGRICELEIETTKPSDAFLISHSGMAETLLCVRLGFLEEGQRLPCPGLPLAGAVFDPGWGFASVTIQHAIQGVGRFSIRSNNLHNSVQGDIFGYRVCPVSGPELPQIGRDLASIRARLAHLTA